MVAARQHIYKGTPASGGIAVGGLSVHKRSAVELKDNSHGTPPQEKARLKRVLQHAQEDIQKAMQELDGTARAVMEFQAELLADEDFLQPVWTALKEGEGAMSAWRRHLEKETAFYREAEDDYLRERYADLQDLSARILSLLGEGEREGVRLENDILVVDDLLPSEFLSLDKEKLKGIAMTGGNPQNHVAILARARQLPLVVGMQLDPSLLSAGEKVILDGEKGELIYSPNGRSLADVRRRLGEKGEEERRAQEFLTLPAMTRNNKRIQLLVNIDDPSQLDNLNPAYCDGIGLVRTEFLFAKKADEEEHFAIYKRIVEWAPLHPVIIRTMDIGGDKPSPDAAATREKNPFLGLRGLRFSLAQRDLFVMQLRALCRAAVFGSLRIMLPMVTVPQELTAARKLLQAAYQQLKKEGKEILLPPVGMMVEVPAAALALAEFDADFYSLGTNDLVQYATAAARDSEYEQVRLLADAKHPGVSALIRAALKGAGTRSVSVCGNIAADESLTSHLLEQGVRSLSVPPPALGAIKQALHRIEI